jgi:putative endonuclease
MPKVFTSKSQKIGQVGEYVAEKYLRGKGFTIVERNVTRKWGEIDIVADRNGVRHFVEVKSTSFLGSGYRPEEQMHPWKIKRFIRTVQSYLLETNYEGDWQCDLCVVHLDMQTRRARVEMLENVV